MEKNSLKTNCKVLVIGGSAGSLEVILQILGNINPNFSFAIVVVLHRGAANDSDLRELLSIKTVLPIKEVDDKDAMQNGVIYLVPGDYHLLFEKDTHFSLDVSEKINYSRPSIDVTFESAAERYGSAVVGLLLSGANADGTKGLTSIKKAGGICCVQDPETARVPFMPQSAITQGVGGRLLKVDEMAGFINSLNVL